MNLPTSTYGAGILKLRSDSLCSSYQKSIQVHTVNERCFQGAVQNKEAWHQKNF